MKVRRDYDLLGRAAKRIYPVTDSEKRCRNEQEAMALVRKAVERRIQRHMALMDDGFIIQLK